jgi:ribonucleoside-diphosphate reductase alpha chain
LEFIDKLYGFIAAEAYLASADLAAEKGAFPLCNTEKYLQGRFIQGLPEHVRKAIKNHGTRNVCVLTQAPTGSTGTMIGTSTGIEPYYSWTYWRKSRLGVKEVQERIVQSYFTEIGEVDPKLTNLPSYFVTAMELTPKEHIQVQAAVQRWTDSSISKTANAPHNYTMEQTKELYEYAYQMGCKGVTIYRDGSRDTQVLTKKDDEIKNTESTSCEADATEDQADLSLACQELAAAVEVAVKAAPPAKPEMRAWTGRPQKLQGATYEWPTPLGKAFITVNEYNGEPMEVFINIGKAGSDIAAMSEALGRLATMFLKHAGLKSADEKVSMLVKHLSDIGGSTSVGFGINRVGSVPDALAKTLKFHVEDTKRSRGIEFTISAGGGMDICPTCGIAALAREEGCYVCKACGYSKC